MAFAKQFHSTYFSSNNTEYNLEIFVDGFVGSSTEIKLGPEGCVISSDTSGQTKFTNIMSTGMSIPFVVEDSSMASFITSLRTTYQEQEVYAHLYVVGTTRPLWSGYILMDLGSEEDVSFPYIVELKATDGIGLLKNHDFVVDGAAVPYDISDTFLAQGTTSGYKTIIDWIEIILLKTGQSLTTQGAANNYTYQTCVQWYNKDHSGTALADDPLALTKCKMDSFYKEDDDGNYSVVSFYDVLDQICKSWGMRCIYWHHTFYFIQISLYKTNESGTVSVPVNVPTREYYYNGGLKGTQNYVGSLALARYELDLENATSPSTGLQKLSGGS